MIRFMQSNILYKIQVLQKKVFYYLFNHYE